MRIRGANSRFGRSGGESNTIPGQGEGWGREVSECIDDEEVRERQFIL